MLSMNGVSAPEMQERLLSSATAPAVFALLQLYFHCPPEMDVVFWRTRWNKVTDLLQTNQDNMLWSLDWSEEMFKGFDPIFADRQHSYVGVMGQQLIVGSF